MRPLVWCMCLCAPLQLYVGCGLMCTGAYGGAAAPTAYGAAPTTSVFGAAPTAATPFSFGAQRTQRISVCVWEGERHTVRGVCVWTLDVGLNSPPPLLCCAPSLCPFAVPLCCAPLLCPFAVPPRCVVLTCRVPCPREPVRHSSCCGHAIRCKRRWAHVLTLMFALSCTVACHVPEYFEFFGMLDCAAQ
jgi:hypothetical protein